MKYLRLKNWEKLQHPSDKPLPWIKFFTALLAPTKEPVIAEWPDHTKTLLYHLWLMARIFNGRIPEDWLTRPRLNLKSRINLKPILDAGFAWFESEDGTRLALSHARDARSGLSSSKEPEASKQELSYEDEFAPLWQDYPRRIGRKEAFRHYASSRKAGHAADEIRQALTRYKAHIQRERIATSFVQHGSTWFNNWQDWTQEPVAATASSRPGFTV